MNKLLNYLETYHQDPSYNQEQEDGRISFLKRFPRENLPNLRVKDYVVGGDNKDTFSVWLEFKKILFGIGGGNASKFGIYVKKEYQTFRTGVGANAKILEGEELQHYFGHLKSNLITAIDLAEQDRIPEIKQLDLPIWNLVLQKILVLYFPEKLINVGSPDVLIAAAKDLGLNNIDFSKENIVEINYELRKKIGSIPEFNGLDYIDIGLIVWEAFKDEVKINYYVIGTKYGGNQEIFPQLLQKSIIATGFASHLELSELVGAKNKEIKQFLELHGEQKSYNALKLFLNLKPGDLVALKADGSPKGKNPFLSIIAIAEVVEREGKYYDHDPDGLGHLITVNFLQAPVYKEFPIGGFGSTLQKVNKDEQIDQIFNTKYDLIMPSTKPPKEQNSPQPLNQILYGPPGTGKTYHTINKAIGIINPNFNLSQDRAEIKKEFDRLVEQEQIVFTTFHQSMSYEDFIEGIKPIEPDKEGDPIIYKIELGLFRKLCVNATFDLIHSIESKETEEVLDFSILYDNYSEKVQEKIFNNKLVELASKSGGVVIVDSISPQGNFIVKHPEGSRTYTVSKARLSKLNTAIINLDDVNNINDKFREIIGGSNSSAYWAVLHAIRKQGKSATKKKSSRNYIFEEKLEVVYGHTDLKNLKGKPYVLIIDEINRGNVSQIFGELITLIEEDKRLGQEEELQVILPYSKKPFGVPVNLYIIGTMNTADRSVEALDAALRRRFSFEEMPPNYTLKELNREVAGFKLFDILETINKRIEKLLDKDHLIGHSYFVKVLNLQDLKLTFQNKIIPLLQEYFFGDYGKIGLILGEIFFENANEDQEVKFKNFFDYTEDGFSERKIYRLKNLQSMKNEDFMLAIQDLVN